MNNLITFLWLRYKLPTVAVPAAIIATPFALWGGGVAPIWIAAVVLVLLIALRELLARVSNHLQELRILFTEKLMLYYVHNADEGRIPDDQIHALRVFVRACPWTYTACVPHLKHGPILYGGDAMLTFSGTELLIAIGGARSGGELMNSWIDKGAQDVGGTYRAGGAPPKAVLKLLKKAST